MKAKLRQSASCVVPRRQEASRKAAKTAAVPQVGIFFLVEDSLHLDTTSITEASAYGEAKVHDLGHNRWWEEMRATQVVPDCEFEEFPRGRVVFQPKLQKFILMADRCILRREDVLKGIMWQMSLPSTTLITTDEHYRCPHCMGKNRTALMLELPDDIR